MRGLIALLGRERGRLFAAALLGLARVAAAAGLLGTSAYLISRAALHPASLLLLLIPIVGVRFFSLARALTRYGERLVAHDLALRLIAHLRGEVFARLLHTSPIALVARPSGEWLQRLAHDVDRLETFAVDAAAPLIVFAGALLVVPGFLAGFGPTLAWALGLPLVLAGLLPLAAHVRSRAAAEHLPAAEADFTAGVVEALEVLADPTLRRRPAAFTATLGARADVAARLRERLAAAVQAEAAWQGLLADLAAILLLVAAGALVLHQRLPGVALAALVLLGTTAFEAAAPLARAYPRLGESVRVAERLGLEERLPERAAGHGVLSLPPGIEVAHLYFRYEAAGPWLLEDVSFSLAPGAAAALLGPSGEGKSTLLSLLAGLLPYERGTIRVGGRELADLPEDVLHAHLAVVSPRSHLFATSIAANLRLARPEATDEELWQVLALVHLDRLVARLPSGLGTLLGQNGFTLSGGERQRLVLAQALLREAPWLILDEPFTGLEPALARALAATVGQRIRGRTVLYVTHEPLPDWPFAAVWHLADGRLRPLPRRSVAALRR